ncbi:MAG: hypothetical protein M5R40_29190 [Anaerolineae bacterium]|nr:hypothetical protein [Anaerolineae bacterium]
MPLTAARVTLPVKAAALSRKMRLSEKACPADEGGDVAPEGAPPEAAIATPLPAFNFTDPDFSAFSSYSANLTAYLEDAGGQRTGSMNLMVRVDTQASAAHVEMLVEGAMVDVVSSGSEEPAPDHMVIVLRDGVTYMLGMTPDGGCMALAGGAPDITSPDSPFTPTGFLPRRRQHR